MTESVTVEDRMVGREEIRQIVPVHDTTLYRMEKRGAFPRRIYLSKTCVVWRLSDVQRWIREQAEGQGAA